MKVPTVEGIIERRMLINFTVDPGIIGKLISPPFRPKIYSGKAIVGICLIRLKHVRPKGFPYFTGISSEIGAHRFAVEWTEDDVVKEGVFIPRRDTSSRINGLAGGRFFPGRHFYAQYDVKESGDNFHVAFKSADGTSVSIDAALAAEFNRDSIFGSLENTSSFFEAGDTGYSPHGKYYEGLQLKAFNWKVAPLKVSAVQSSYFEDENNFPRGAVQFDNALLMTQVRHEWHSLGKKNQCP